MNGKLYYLLEKKIYGHIWCLKIQLKISYNSILCGIEYFFKVSITFGIPNIVLGASVAFGIPKILLRYLFCFRGTEHFFFNCMIGASFSETSLCIYWTETTDMNHLFKV